MRIRPLFVLLAAMALNPASPAVAQSGPRLDDTWMEGFQWRSIGPANMSGRVTDIEGLPSPSKTFYVAAAAGGIWKTTNNGTTFRPLFQNERVASLVSYIRDQQGEYGLWTYESAPQASRWITFDILRSLSHLTQTDWVSTEPRTPFRAYNPVQRRY